MPDILTPEDEATLLSADADELEGDMILSPTAPEEVGAAETAKEARIFSGQPHGVFTLESGKTLSIYSKSEGQLANISKALQEWLDTSRVAEEKATRRFMWLRRRRGKMEVELSRVQNAKYQYFQAIFQEPYIKEQDQVLTPNEFLSLTLEQQTQVSETHRKANDVTALLRAIIGPESFDGKKNGNPVMLRDGT